MTGQTGPEDTWQWYRPMTARSTDEHPRAATSLELFFDLCFVIAVAQAAAGFEHEVTSGHVAHGVVGYTMVFFAIWWAWMNFTWFASAYDTDDVLYRLLTLIQILGALAVAAGAAKALEKGDFSVIAVGYMIMRLATVGQWLRAAYSDHERRACCLRYAAGIFVVQCCWALVAFAGVPDAIPFTAVFAALVILELAIAPWAERPAHTTWHPHHITERFGLFTLIVLGETVAASANAVRLALETQTPFSDIASLSGGGILTVYAMWWLYFSYEERAQLTSLASALRWGYGHYALFASAAAVGAGLSVNIAHATGHIAISHTTVAASYTIPVVLYVATLRLLRRRGNPSTTLDTLWILAVLGVLTSTFSPNPVLITGLVTSVMVTAVLATVSRSKSTMRAT